MVPKTKAVVEICSPGTKVGEQAFDSNYLMSVCFDEYIDHRSKNHNSTIGISYVDLSTGETQVKENNPTPSWNRDRVSREITNYTKLEPWLFKLCVVGDFSGHTVSVQAWCSWLLFLHIVMFQAWCRVVLFTQPRFNLGVVGDFSGHTVSVQAWCRVVLFHPLFKLGVVGDFSGHTVSVLN
jgi:hypothetical protein